MCILDTNILHSSSRMMCNRQVKQESDGEAIIIMFSVTINRI